MKSKSLQAGLIAMLMMQVAFSQPGSLDKTFGDGGFVLTNVGKQNCFGYDVAVQHDGKIVVSGKSKADNNITAAVLIRYNTDGSLDSTFGRNGVVSASFTKQFDLFSRLALQADGKIVVTGLSIRNDTDFVLFARYTSKGKLDTKFRTAQTALLYEGFGCTGTDVAVQGDGKILLQFNNNQAGTYLAQTQIFRYKPNGDADTKFGNNGGFVFTGNFWFTNMSIAFDGKILNVGGDGLSHVMRVKKNGTLDNSFGTGGVVSFAVSTFDGPNVILGQADGKVLLGGFIQGTDFVSTLFSVTRLNEDGSLDLSFNGTGFNGLFIQGNDIVEALNFESDGKLIASGYSAGRNFTYMALVRYDTSSGHIDPTWGQNGTDTVATSLGGERMTYGIAAAISPDNQHIVVGGQQVASFTKNLFATARFNLYGPSPASRILHEVSSLHAQVYPNPGTNYSYVSFNLINSDDVRIIIYNVAGQEMKMIDPGSQTAGNHTMLLNVSDLTAGTIFCSDPNFWF